MHRPQLLDLFCGAGGMSLGAARAGFDVMAGIDFDQRALKAHKTNFPHCKDLALDISTTSAGDIYKEAGLLSGQIDVITGGPPCQGFSSIGKKEPSDIRNQLVTHYFRLISELRPKAFVMENVPGVLSERNKDILDFALSQLDGIYRVLPPRKLRANEVGAPTVRQRVIIVGFRADVAYGIDDFWDHLDLEKAPVVRHALDGLPVDVPPIISPRNGRRKVSVKRVGHFFESVTNRVPEKVGDAHSLELYEEKSIVTGCLGTLHSPELESRYAKLEYGEQDPKTKSVKLDPGGYCPTLRAGTGPEKGSFQAVRPIHYLRPRVITPREAARLQGFPDWFQFDNTKWHAFRQIGNSVSPLVSESVLKNVFRCLFESEMQ
ncbi:Cytosine-specific methyltransferase [Cupriavidus taiwanensis]|nr:Cytosine-specific methyltransferase [Cupriavidus taiwanensis]